MKEVHPARSRQASPVSAPAHSAQLMAARVETNSVMTPGMAAPDAGKLSRQLTADLASILKQPQFGQQLRHKVCSRARH